LDDVGLYGAIAQTLMENIRNKIKSLQQFLRTLSLKRVIYFITGSVIIFFFFLFVLFLFTWAGLLGHLPDDKELREIKNPAATEVYSADSVLLGKYFLQERSNVSAEHIPKHVVNAVIATEDVRFYDHHGIDWRSLGRVAIKSILFGQESSGGGSTIEQQLAKNLYPRKNYWFFSLFINKMREFIIASRLEGVYEKNEILALYLNTVPFGDNTFGLQAAAQRFFSISVQNLSINQGALLVGMLKATHLYNPRIYPERSLTRRNVVLGQLARYKMISTEALDSLKRLPINLKYNKVTHNSGLAAYFREYLRLELLEWCDQYNASHDVPVNLYTSGLKIYTTIDSRLQRHAEQAMTRQMSSIQNIFLKHWTRAEPWAANPEMIEAIVKKSDRYKQLELSGMDHEAILEEMKKPVPMNIFTWEGEKEVMMSSIDSIKHYLKFLNAGVLAIDPSQGAVKVWVGGINHQYFQYDHVKETTRRQVGSTFKPIIYAAALEQGARPCAFIQADKITYTNVDDWAPKNTEDNYDLKYSMPGALAYSVNTVSVRVLEKAGINNTIQVARDMGINSPLAPVPSLALGSAEVSMIEMVNAYTSFANEGKVGKPFYLTAIVSSTGEILEEFQPATAQQAISEENAELMLHMLKRAVNEGTSRSLRSQFLLTNDLAGKTGTTQMNTDGWFIAITPKLVIGAWVGADDPRIRFRSTALGQGARTALPIIGDFFQHANRDPAVSSVLQARFPELSFWQENKINCGLYKSSSTLFKRFKNDDSKRAFSDKKSEKKKGLFKRLFN